MFYFLHKSFKVVKFGEKIHQPTYPGIIYYIDLDFKFHVKKKFEKLKIVPYEEFVTFVKNKINK